MKKILFIAFLFAALSSFAQVGLNTTAPHASSVIDITSTTKGFLFPRMTHAQKTAIVSPTAGLVVWCTNCGTSGEMQVYDGLNWVTATGGTSNLPLPAPVISYANTNLILNDPATITPTVSGVVASFSISPSLPAGLILNTSTGVISGTPTQAINVTTFTITATNSGGVGTASMQLMVSP